KVTRNSNTAGYDLELISVVDVLATGSVKVKEASFSTSNSPAFTLTEPVANTSTTLINSK
ncbi:hypothetical protein PVK04_23245, partial [Salmonella enterica subsp. enterica serovar Typhi]|nr:hypothetical protein [Salmonella enterica subsp. enterica serovar Typhi]